MFSQFLAKWNQFRAAWAGLRGFNQLPRAKKRIVFYAETEADWAFLGPVASRLVASGNPVVKVTSDAGDSVLDEDMSFYVGFGTPRTILFRTIEADAFVMTLPDLESFQLKRSVHPVHYFYLFHSMASTHRVYQEHAFDAYDTILCVGSHHEQEIRRTEAVYGLSPKRLVAHGYDRLDTLMEAIRGGENQGALCEPDSPCRILIAPSWGECSLVKHCLETLIQSLLHNDSFLVKLRLHPMTVRHQPSLVTQMETLFADTGRFQVETRINTTQSFLDADVMISEWSGAALEYAFSRERPVIFIDTPPKIHNKNWDRLGLECFEDAVRGQIGKLVALDRISEVPEAVLTLIADAGNWAERIREVRARYVYNVGCSAEAGAQAILEHFKKDSTSNTD